jgi:hypothetical protein
VSYYRVVQVKTNAKLTFPLPQQLNTIKIDRGEAGETLAAVGAGIRSMELHRPT